MTHTWMRHPDAVMPAEIPDGAVALFEQRGWERLPKPPAEANPALADYPTSEPAAEPAPQPIAEPDEAPAKTKTKGGVSRG